MRKYMMMAALAAMVCGCTENVGNSYTISGTFENSLCLLCDSAVLLNVESDEPVISIVPLHNGSFTFSGQVDTMHLALITPASDSLLLMVREGMVFHSDSLGHCLFLLEPGKMQMTRIDGNEYGVKGTKANDAFFKFQSDLTELQKESEDGGIRYDDIDFEGRLKANLDNWFGVYCLNSIFDAFSDSDGEMEAALEILDMFPDNVKLSPAWQSVYNAANSRLALAIGKPYLDFTQNDADGNPVSAKDVISDRANKYVLIDFWASWCGPCMGELPYMKDAYAKYAPKGFQILGVSLDREREAWVNAVRNNEMNWIHVSDLNYWQNEVARQYNINSVPSNFLIDCSTGCIVAKDLRGEELAEKLAELL